MALLHFENIGVKAIAACVPSNVEPMSALTHLLREEDVAKTIASTGIRERRIAPVDVCASDLAFTAAQQLLNENNVDRETIGGLIFVSQTPDYRQPATAMSLQHRLGLPKTTMSFDVNLACSGYVYGLSLAYSLVAAGADNILLLAGDTLSKTISRNDKATTPLFGDAATATLVGRDPDAGKSFFSLNSDGGGANILNIPYGGYRNPSSEEGFKEIANEYGSRNGEQLYMNGIEVFNFGLREAAKDIKSTLAIADKQPDEIDVIYFHQANKLMTDLIAKKLKATAEKVPYSLDRFGNTSSASIPLTIVATRDTVARRSLAVACGFGAGLSWGTAIMDLNHAKISDLIEF